MIFFYTKHDIDMVFFIIFQPTTKYGFSLEQADMKNLETIILCVNWSEHSQ